MMAILNLCRICLIEAHRSKGMQPLFDDSNEQCIKIVQMIEECGGVVLKPLDNYPRMICVQCLEALYASYQFRSMCQASESAIIEAILRMKPRLHSKINGITGCSIKSQSVRAGEDAGEPFAHSVHSHPLHILNQDIAENRYDNNTNVDEIYLDLRSEFIEGHDVEFEELNNVKTEFEQSQNYITIEDMNTDLSILRNDRDEDIDEINHSDDGNDDDDEDHHHDIDNESDDTEDRIVTTISVDNETKNSDALEHENHHMESEAEHIQEDLEHIEMAELSELSPILIHQSKSKNNNNRTITHNDDTNAGERISRLSRNSKGKNIFCGTASNGVKAHKSNPQKNEENKIEDKSVTITSHKGNRRKRKTDSEPEANICEICGNIYSKRSILNMHMRRHRAEKPFECEICGKTFTCPSEISRHIRIHTGEKPYICRFCGRTFTDRSTNIKHERIHTNERPFTCQTCGKSFTYSNVLKNHILTHTGEKPFLCIPCNKTFSRKHQLDQHLGTLTHRQASKLHSTTSSNSTDEQIMTTTSTVEMESSEKLTSNKPFKKKMTTSSDYKYKRIKITANLT